MQNQGSVFLTFELPTGLSTVTVHPLLELLHEHLSQLVVRVQSHSLVEVVDSLTIVARAVLPRVGHDKGGVVETLECSKVGALSVFHYRHGLDALDHAQGLVDILLRFAVARLRTHKTKQEHSLLVLGPDTVGVHGLQALQRGKLLLHRGVARLGVQVKNLDSEDGNGHHAAASRCCQHFRNLQCHKLYYFSVKRIFRYKRSGRSH